MEQTKALLALEPFLVLAKSATSPPAAAELVTRATSHPVTFLFTELLATPQIQALARSPEHAAYLALLHLFAHGTWADYCAANPPLPTLNDAQTHKLRLLTLLTLAARHPDDLRYPTLQAALGLVSPPSQPTPASPAAAPAPAHADDRALEELVISAVYAGLLDAALDPARRCVCVARVAPLRDCTPAAVPAMVTALTAWAARCDAALLEIDRHAQAVRRTARGRAADAADAAARLQAALAQVAADPPAKGKSHKFGKRGMGLAENDDDEAMELYDDLDLFEGEKKRARNRRL